MNTEKIPQTDSTQELAEFWETHDLTDFEDRLEEITEPIFEHETRVLIRLQPTEVKILKEVAQAKGIDYTDLIKEWVSERIHTA